MGRPPVQFLHTPHRLRAADDKAFKIHVLDRPRELHGDVIHCGKENQPLDLTLKAEVLVQDDVLLAAIVPLHEVGQSVKESRVLAPTRVARCVMNIVATLQEDAGFVHKAIGNGHSVKEHFV